MSNANSQITEADVVTWLTERVRAGLDGKSDMGLLEKAVDQATLEMPSAGASDARAGDGHRPVAGVPAMCAELERGSLRPCAKA